MEDSHPPSYSNSSGDMSQLLSSIFSLQSGEILFWGSVLILELKLTRCATTQKSFQQINDLIHRHKKHKYFQQ